MHPDYSWTFLYICIDASDIGIGAVLLQYHDILMPVAYAIRFEVPEIN